MLNIVIPMAGAGSRFAKAGYKLPKPLIQIGKKTMIQLVIENLTPKCSHRFIFICQNSHILDYKLETLLNNLTNNPVIIGIEGITEGAACTVLKAIEHINNQDELMIANSDQFVDIDINEYLSTSNKHFDGYIMTMKATDSKWSYVKQNEDGLVTEVAEKKVISDEATVGIYNFQKGQDFVRAAKNMIEKNDRVNNEFYVAPVYNYLIVEHKQIGIYNIGTDINGMYGLGIPEDLDYFCTIDKFKHIWE